MAVGPVFLADKSALARDAHPRVRPRLGPLVAEGLVATCPIVDLEVLYSARSSHDYEVLRAGRRALPSKPVTSEVTDRALEVQRLLARRGQHRRPLPDLLIAATAEVHGLTVLHYDADFDLIAAVTRQPVSWIAPRGSL